MDRRDFYITGIHPVIEALESGKKIDKVLFKQGLEGTQFRTLLERLQERKIAVQFVPLERLNKISKSNHQGVIALISRIDYFTMEQIVDFAKREDRTPLVLILDGVSDVRNFGAIARSAECAGADAIVVPAKGSANINEEAIKASAGALLRIPVSKVTNIREAIFFLKESGYKIVSSSERGEKTIYETSFKGATAIIAGSEERGVSSSALKLSDEIVRIPMVGKISSLNVSAAVTVLLFETLRQRGL